MGESFVGTVKSFRSDAEGECQITFTIPKSHKPQATQVSDWTEEALFISVLRAHEVEGA